MTHQTGPSAIAHVAHYRLVPESTHISFTTTHLLGLGKVTGSVRLLSGRLSIDLGQSRLVQVEAELDMTSFASASRARDRAVASPAFLDSATHPTASYRSTGVVEAPEGWQVNGTLTVRGVSAPVELLIRDLDLAPNPTAHASGTLDRFDYGIRFPVALASRRLGVDISVHAVEPDEQASA